MQTSSSGFGMAFVRCVEDFFFKMFHSFEKEQLVY